MIIYFILLIAGYLIAFLNGVTAISSESKDWKETLVHGLFSFWGFALVIIAVFMKRFGVL